MGQSSSTVQLNDIAQKAYRQQLCGDIKRAKRGKYQMACTRLRDVPVPAHSLLLYSLQHPPSQAAATRRQAIAQLEQARERTRMQQLSHLIPPTFTQRLVWAREQFKLQRRNIHDPTLVCVQPRCKRSSCERKHPGLSSATLAYFQALRDAKSKGISPWVMFSARFKGDLPFEWKPT